MNYSKNMENPPVEPMDKPPVNTLENFNNVQIIHESLEDLIENLGDLFEPDDFNSTNGFPILNNVQRWIWSEVYTSLESGMYGNWTPFNGVAFPQNTRPYVRHIEVTMNVLTQLLGAPTITLLMNEIIPRWGAFLIREVHTEDDFEHIETLKHYFIIELIDNFVHDV